MNILYAEPRSFVEAIERYSDNQPWHYVAPIIRSRLVMEQDWVCAICGSLMDHEYPELIPTIDHVIPKKLNGPDKLGNFVAVHKLCNERKGNQIPTGCECIWLLAVNARLGVRPQKW